MTDLATRRRLTNIIFMTQSLFAAGQIAIITLIAIVAVELSGRESAAGLPTTTLTLTQSLTALPLGILMGQLGRRFGLSLSYGLSMVGALLGVVAVLQSSFWLLLLSSAFLGMGRAGGDQSRYAAGDMFDEGQRARMIGRVVFAGTIGAIFGPLLVAPGSWLAVALDLPENAGPWLLGLFIYGAALTITLLLLRPDPLKLAQATSAAEDKADPPPTHLRPTGQLLRLGPVQLAIAAMLISQAVMVALMVITPVHMTHHHYGKGDISLVIAVHTLGMFGLSSLTGYLIDRYGTINVMILAAVTLIISAVIAPLSAAYPFLLVGLFLLGLGWNFGYIAGSTLLSASLRGLERSRMQGTSDMLVAGAAALGSFSSGPIFSLSGYAGVAVVGIIATLLFGWLIFLLGRRTAQAVEVSPQV